jgi:hypothetical protein
MLKKLWQSLGGAENSSDRRKIDSSETSAPELVEADYEFLFLQLLEGVAHGWQQPRIVSFFEAIEDRISESQWLAWLERFGSKLLASAHPNNDLASRMVQLGEMRCGAIGDSAYDLGMQVLTRGQNQVFVDVEDGEADIFEFAGADLTGDLPSISIPEGDLTSEEMEAESEVKEVSLAEFMAILQEDPELAQRLSQELGVDSTDPQILIQALVAQAEQPES